MDRHAALDITDHLFLLYEDILRECSDGNGSDIVTVIVNGARVRVPRPLDYDYEGDY